MVSPGTVSLEIKTRQNNSARFHLFILVIFNVVYILQAFTLALQQITMYFYLFISCAFSSLYCKANQNKIQYRKTVRSIL
jgi:hypothetical protein